MHERLRDLERENEQLRARLERLETERARAEQARATLMRGGFRLLIPLFDRQKVVRSFGKLLETVSGFGGPAGEWPSRDVVLADARLFMEAVVRFLVRRRMFLLMFGLLGALIPAVQVWLVIQQNEIIENQNEFFQIQVYDIVARSMTEGDRNARLMTGALLANADPEFLSSVVRESFDPSLASVYRAEGVNAQARRLDDAAYRGHLIRAAVHSADARRDRRSLAETYAVTRPMLRMILADASGRVPEVMRFGRSGEEIAGERAEQVDHYLVQVGEAFQTYGRLARASSDLATFGRDVAPLLTRLSQRGVESDNRFAAVYRAMLQDVLFEMAAKPLPGDPEVSAASAGRDPKPQLQAGLDELRRMVPGDAIDWSGLARQAGAE